MKIIDDYNNNINNNYKPISLFDFNENDNNDQLLCGIIQNLWALQDSIDNNQNYLKTNNNTLDKENNVTFNLNDKIDDSFEIQALLYEIDMNLEYFRNDYREFEDYDLDINIDKFLSFSFIHEACNIYLYELETSYKFASKKHLAELFENVDKIPEFVPIFQNEFADDCANMGVGGEIDLYNLDEDTIYDEYLNNEDLCALNMGGGNGDIFENVYNYMPPDDEANEEGLSSNSQYLAAYYLRRKLAASLDIDNSSSSSSASSLNAGTTRFIIPRLIKTTKDIFRKPCVYMLNEGRCMRSDCRFAHDLHNITCKYWLEGECLKGDSCEFLHDFAPTSTATSSSLLNQSSFTSKTSKNFTELSRLNKQKAKDFNLNTSEFPELSASVTSTKSSATTATTNSTWSKLRELDSNEINKISNNYSEIANSNESLNKINTNNNNNNNNSINDENTKPISTGNNKKSRKFKDNVLYSFALPALQLASRKKNIN